MIMMLLKKSHLPKCQWHSYSTPLSIMVFPRLALFSNTCQKDEGWVIAVGFQWKQDKPYTKYTTAVVAGTLNGSLGRRKRKLMQNSWVPNSWTWWSGYPGQLTQKWVCKDHLACEGCAKTSCFSAVEEKRVPARGRERKIPWTCSVNLAGLWQ